MSSKGKPYIETVEGDHFVRIFRQSIDEDEMQWHYDTENRIIKSIEPTDWLFQFEDALPISLNQEIFIPKGVYHRGIKGTGDLKIKLYKL